MTVAGDIQAQIAAAILRADPGAGEFVIRGRWPMSLGLLWSGHVVEPQVAPQAEVVAAETGAEPEVRAVVTEDPDEASASVVVAGTASSTSVDWYKTEMSVKCLDSMGQQFMRGVSMTPSHGTYSQPLEWYDVLGPTTRGTVKRAIVAEAADPSEQGYVLDFEAKLDASLDRTKDLVGRLKRGQPIGTSIGGWFTEVRYVRGEDGEVTRIIIENVELDHLAIVRRPANPDADNLKLLSAAWADVQAQRAAPAPTPVQPPEPTPEATQAAEPVERGVSPAAAAPNPTPSTVRGADEDIIMTNEELQALLSQMAEDGKATRAAAEQGNKTVNELSARVAELEAQRNAKPEPVVAVTPSPETRRIQATEPTPVQRTPEVDAEEAMILAIREQRIARIATDVELGERFDAMANAYGSEQNVRRTKDAFRVQTRFARSVTTAKGAKRCFVADVIERNMDFLCQPIQPGKLMQPGQRARDVDGVEDLLREICRAGEADGVIGFGREWGTEVGA